MIDGADLLIGLSGARALPAEALARMNDDAMVFAMANPNPEVTPEEAARYVRIMATGRSDYPNQINNVLCFPGIFRGALDVRAPAITEEMKMAAARAIAAIVDDSELREDYIIPSVFNREVAPAVAAAVAEQARAAGDRARRAAGRVRAGRHAHAERGRHRRGRARVSDARRMSELRATVTGATGLLGARVVEALRGARRTRDRAHARPARGRAAGSATVEAIAWEPAREPAPGAALDGRDCLVQPRRRADRAALERDGAARDPRQPRDGHAQPARGHARGRGRAAARS